MDKKKEELILVVPREILLCNDSFQGYRDASEVDYESRILNNPKFRSKGYEVEHDFSLKQPIAYLTIFNQKLNEYFLYQRSKKISEYSETRLLGKWSLGLGGHINCDDNKKGNPILESIEREVMVEEVKIQEPFSKPRLIGYINDDQDEVGKVHFGLHYLIEINHCNVIPKDKEISNHFFVRPSFLEYLIEQSTVTRFENWTKIVFENKIKPNLS